MKKKIFLILLIFVMLIGLTGCGEKTNKNSLNDLVDIEKIYYKENDNGSISMYLTYTISSDIEKDITIDGSDAKLKTDLKEYGGLYGYVDINKDLIEEAGFQTVSDYKTLYGGSNEKIKYLVIFSINKNYFEARKKLTLLVKINGDEYIEKEIDRNKINIFKYTENSEFITEFKKDYLLYNN